MPIDTPIDEVRHMRKKWDMVDSLYGGTDAIRLKSETYLPRWPAETHDTYAYRLRTSFLFNVFHHTVNTLAAKPFEKLVRFDEKTPPDVLIWAQDIDQQGRNFHVFSHEVFKAAMKCGHSFILVDYPSNVSATTKQAELEAGIRPYFTHILAENVVGWKTETILGKQVLTEVRIQECYDDPKDDDDYELEEKTQIRVLNIGSWKVFRKDDAGGWFVFEQGTISFPIIPLVPVYTNRCSWFVSNPPLIDIAFLNLEHWQKASDLGSILHTASVPILAVSGINDTDPLIVGSKAAVKLPLGGEMKYVEHTGKAIEAGRIELQDIEIRMRTLGAQMLVKKPGTISATQASIEKTDNISDLQSMTRILEDALNLALSYMCKWANLPDTATVTVFQDFSVDEVTGTSEVNLLNAAISGQLSTQTFFEELQRRGTVRSELTWAEESARIAASVPVDTGTATGVATSPAPGDQPAASPTPAPTPAVDLTPILDGMSGIATAMQTGLQQMCDKMGMGAADTAGEDQMAAAVATIAAAITTLADKPDGPITVNCPPIEIAPQFNAAPVEISLDIQPKTGTVVKRVIKDANGDITGIEEVAT